MCGEDWGYYGHEQSKWSLVQCDMFLYPPFNWKHKLKWWLFFLAVLILSPLYNIFCIICFTFKYVRLYEYIYLYCDDESFINRLLVFSLTIPWNAFILSLNLAIALFLAAVGTPFTTPYFIYVNICQFVKIMRYWSSGRRSSAKYIERKKIQRVI